ncbi:tetratricopeptide repeat protein [Flavobacterium sp. XS2P14]|uniref:tetratricopeptide repeat protein n=1 Tax=Flavobacterium sp. XS2P14 TaxID=3401735 RepID=UPI003AAA5E44
MLIAFMNVTDYTYLINKPDATQEKQTEALEKVLDEFPYFQSARAIQLKGLYNQNSYKYNEALKTTAAYSTDRSVLFEFITSDTFTSIQKGLYDKKALEILDIQVVDSEIIATEVKQETKINAIERSILTSIKEATPIQVDEQTKSTEEKLSIGQPLDFSKSEQHSFQEWLQLSRKQPIQREKEIQTPSEYPLHDDDKRKKLKLIDKFIQASPKISPIKHGVASTITFESHATDTSFLMTETLARVYLEQKKYQKAIQAYEILILKYPEKSSFFADRISDIKILHNNNNN